MRKIETVGKPEYVLKEEQFLLLAKRIAEQTQEEYEQIFFKRFFRGLSGGALLKILVSSFFGLSSSSRRDYPLNFATHLHEKFKQSCWNGGEGAVQSGTSFAKEVMQAVS